MQELTGREVEVSTYDTVYRGILIEVGEADVHLQSESGWLVIPVEKIVDIKAVV
ncbi:MAG: hypothetical protein HY757_04260 [Nitrospirae bacterium]|nr:hypothetical protein [Nitrospirota bacterium]